MFINKCKPASAARRPPRGAAEIEMILLIPLLLTVMLLIGAMDILGPARIANVFGANELALRDASVSPQPSLAAGASLDPLPEIMTQVNPDLPALPNRLHEAVTQKVIAPTKFLTRMTLSEKAIYPSPAYTFSSYPVESDKGYLANWFSAYADQSKSEVQGPLGLAPAFPP